MKLMGREQIAGGAGLSVSFMFDVFIRLSALERELIKAFFDIKNIHINSKYNDQQVSP